MFDSSWVPHPRINPGLKKDAISAGPKQDFLLHAATIHSPAIKALQNAKIKNSPNLFLTL